MIEPVVKSVEIDCAPLRAFEIFTKDTAKWWPLGSHSISAKTGTPAKDLTIAGHVGGRIEETAPNGDTHLWGSITEWDPGNSVAFTWHVGGTPDKATEVSVKFEPSGSGTRVTLTHSNWDVLGEDGLSQRNGYDGGWVGVMEDGFANHCARLAA